MCGFMGKTEEKRKILYITGTRADFGLMMPVLKKIDKSPFFDLEIAATGMHLMDEFGNTIDDVKKEGFKTHIIDAIYEKDTKESMARFIGIVIQKLSEKIGNINPDILLLLGDRGEMLAGAIVGSYMTIPVAHMHGGEVTSTVDESTRHAITKLSHIHLAATKGSAERIIKMGEDPKNVFVVGAPGLDNILNKELISPDAISKQYDLDISKPIVVVLQHPVTIEIDKCEEQIRETMDAVAELGYQTIAIYPNADTGGRKMIDAMNRYKSYKSIRMFKNIPSDEYLSILNISSVMVGNSSGSIIEAPSFGLPVVNVGIRQDGRERSENIIDVDHDKDEIKRAIEKAINDKDFKKQVNCCENPYENGNASDKIVDVLAGIKINKELIQKKITY